MSAASESSPRTLRRVLNVAGPFFGLVLVIVLFAGLLALQDISRHMQDNGLSGASGWKQAVKEGAFDGCRAFVSGVPAELVDDFDVGDAALMLGVAGVFAALGWGTFTAGLRRYSSGSAWGRG